MPEFFDISLISKKTSTSITEMNACLNQFRLCEGENKSELFHGKQVIVSFFDDEESDFEVMNIGIPEQLFTKENFDSELELITNFVNTCFQYNQHLKYALGSYEINGYLIGQIKKISYFNNDEFLNRFPILYKRIEDLELPCLQINSNAQEIFE